MREKASGLPIADQSCRAFSIASSSEAKSARRRINMLVSFGFQEPSKSPLKFLGSEMKAFYFVKLPIILLDTDSMRDNQRHCWVSSTPFKSLDTQASADDQSAAGLVFHISHRDAHHGKRITMPRPPTFFCSLSSTTSSSPYASSATPKLVGMKISSVSKESEERILISQVELLGVDGELKSIAESVIKTRANFAYTSDEVKEDIKRIFSTGWFMDVRPEAVDTRDGVKLVIKVKAHDQVNGMKTSGANVLPTVIVEKAFAPVFGQTLNMVNLREAVGKIDQWYADHGVLGQVSGYNFEDGIINLRCAEASVDSISLKFIKSTKNGDVVTPETNEKPRTRPQVVLRHLTTKKGQVYNLHQAQRDIASIYAMGIFDDVSIAPKESDDSTAQSPKLDLVIKLVEKKTMGIGGGGGLSAHGSAAGGMPGVVGNFSFTEKNLFGLNQKLSAQAEIGQVEKMFRLVWTDPWLSWPEALGDEHRTSRTVSLTNNRSPSSLIHGRAETDDPREASTGPSGSVMLGRLIGGVEFQRPLSSTWSSVLSLHCQKTSCSDEHGSSLSKDIYGAPLTFSGRCDDKVLLASSSASYSHPRGDLQATLALDQSIPVQRDWLRFSRFKFGFGAQYPLIGGRGASPVSDPGDEGGGGKRIQGGPNPPILTLGVRAKGGHVIGDLPPYEAFPIGGNSSVRGYSEGAVGSGRSWLEASAELRFPIVQAINGTLFVDSGMDFNSGASVVGDPAGIRNKPGKGYGYGGGLRMDTPLGPLRIEYAWNDKRIGRFHVGVGNE